ncbi:MAG: type II toxin-antitoxin system RelB/DinJ family antitoxin [Clostridiales bacterium]|jgi:DNA-damage-inducible protein J|nr:type II toxin-antitoxin system RelB/DinJ family antitoxin [Clostridiales bacterium]
MAQKTSNLNIRIDPELKKSVENLYSEFGITITDAVNMFFKKSLMEGGLPFALSQPRYNAVTEAAMKEGEFLAREAKEGKIKGFSSVREMLDDIGV